jgi:glycosyltransferase involved in cell wall biosynthesis
MVRHSQPDRTTVLIHFRSPVIAHSSPGSQNRMDSVRRPDQPLISVIVPLFNEEENLPELYRRLVNVFESAHPDFELVFVDDGSRDRTALLLGQLHAEDSRVIVVSLSRNFGHQAAITAGMDHAQGDAVIVMDGDLQDPPEVLPLFVSAWRAGHDVVYAVRTQRKEGLLKRICYAAFYRVYRAVSELDVPLDSGDFCLLDRRVVDILKALPERNRFVRGLRTYVGFQQVGVEYERAARQAGQPKYTFRALCRLALDGIINFSNVPLSLVSIAGAMCVGGSLLAGAATLIHGALDGAVPGWWFATLAVFFCTGLQLCGMGILAEYVRRIFLETKARPPYIVAALKRRLTLKQTTPLRTLLKRKESIA